MEKPQENLRQYGNEKAEQDLEAGDTEGEHTSTNKDPPNGQAYLWTGTPIGSGEYACQFLGFEPTFTVCIKDLEWQIQQKLQRSKILNNDPETAREITPMLIQYSQLIDGLDRILAKEKVINDIRTDGLATRFSGTRRQISLGDNDTVYKNLDSSVVLAVIAYIWSWDVAGNLKKRFGNLTLTLERVLAGIAGGAALLLPMIIMNWVTQQHWRLLIVSLATIAFAAAMGVASSSTENVITATAAYAAIMVVYIGSSSGGS